MSSQRDGGAPSAAGGERGERDGGERGGRKCRPISAPGLEGWKKEVQSRQQEHYSAMSAEDREKFTNERRRREGARQAAQKAKCLSRGAEMSTMAFNCGQRGGEYRSARGEASLGWQSRIQEAQTVVLNSADTAEAEDTLNRLEQEIETMNVQGGAAAVLDTEEDARAVLETFRKEPSDDEETQKKCQVFESYFATIEKLRGDIDKFWAESMDLFEGRSQQECKRLMKETLESEQNMGVHDRTDVWIMWLMLRQCQRNEKSMRGLLKTLETRLEILGGQNDCPVCLDTLEDAEGGVTTLGCCHKVCTSCWKYWTQMQPSAFCPVCRQHDFLDAVGIQA